MDSIRKNMEQEGVAKQAMSEKLKGIQKAYQGDKKQTRDPELVPLTDKQKEAVNTYQKVQGIDPNAIERSPDKIRGLSKKEIEDYKFANSPIGKTLTGIKYIGSKASKGVTNVISGVNGLLADIAESQQYNPQSPLFGRNIQDGIDSYREGSNKVTDKVNKFTDYGMTEGEMSSMDNNLIMSNLGGATEFGVPAAIGAYAKIPQAAIFGLQGLGGAKEETKKLRDAGTPLDPEVEKLYEYGSATLQAALFGGLLKGVFGKQPLGLRKDIISGLSADLVKQAAEKNLTGAEFKDLLNNGVKDLQSKGIQALYKMAESGQHATTSLLKLNAGTSALKLVADKLNSTPVFNQTVEEVADGFKHAVMSGGIFGIAGGAGALSKLTKYSKYKNEVVENLMIDPSVENLMKVKEQVTEHGANEGWSEQEVKDTLGQIDNIGSITAKLKATEQAVGGKIKTSKLEDAVDLVNGRTELQEQLRAVKEGAKDIDESVSGVKNPNEQYLVDKIDQANDKLADMITGKKTKYEYDKEADKYFKVRGEEKTAIDKSRYDLEQNEKPYLEDNIANERKPVESESTFKNIIKDGGIVLGEAGEKSHITDSNFTYRSLGKSEIEAIAGTGGVYPREGKQKGGNKNVKYWSKGNGKLFYEDNQDVIRVRNENINDSEVVKSKDLEVWDKDKNIFVPFDKFYRETKSENSTEYFDQYKKAADKSKTVNEAYAEVTKNGAKLSDTFNSKYNPDGKLSQEETFARFYDEINNESVKGEAKPNNTNLKDNTPKPKQKTVEALVDELEEKVGRKKVMEWFDLDYPDPNRTQYTFNREIANKYAEKAGIDLFEKTEENTSKVEQNEPIQISTENQGVEAKTVPSPKEDVKSYGYEDVDQMSDEKEVAKSLYQEMIDPSELSAKEQAIRQFGGVTTTEDSYSQFGDRNNLSKESRKNYIRKNAQSLDALAEEISSKGLEVTPADLVDYIDKFGEGDNRLSAKAEALKEKLFDMTGKKFNKFTVKNYVDKINERARKEFLAGNVQLSPEEIGVLNSNDITLDNIDAIAEKLDFLYDKETFENIKSYLQNGSKETNGRGTDESGTKPTQTSGESTGLEKQPKATKILTDSEETRRLELRKKFSGRFNDITNIIATLADKEFREYAGLVLKEVRGEFKAWSQEMIDGLGEKIREHLPKLYNELGGKDDISKEFTGIDKENIDNTRKDLGLDEIKRIRKADEELYKQADKWIEDGKSIPDLLNRIEKGSLPSDVENVVLKQYISSLEARNNKNPSSELLADINRATKLVTNARSELGRALRIGAGEVAVVDNLSNFLLEEMDALGVENIRQSMIDELKSKYEKGQSAKEAYEEGYEKAKQEFIQQQAEAELNKQKSKSKSNRPNVKKTDADFKSERSAIVESMRQKLKQARIRTNAVPLPYLAELVAISPDVAKLVKSYVEQGVSKLDDLVKNIKSDLEDAIPEITDNDVRDLIAGEYRTKRPTKNELLAEIRELKQQAILSKKIEDLENGKMPSSESGKQRRTQEIDALKKRVKELEDETGVTDIKGNEARRKQIDKRMKQLQEDVELGNFDSDNPVPRKLKLDAETQKKQDEYIKFLKETNVRRDNARYEQLSIGRKGWEKLQQFLGLRRLIQTSLDFSMPFRQAITVTLNPRYVKPTLQSFSNMFKSTFSEKNFNRIMFNIENDPLYSDMREDKLVFSDVDSKDNLKRDEDFRTSFLYQIPYLREPFLASNRAAAGYINTARYELYIKGVERLKRSGITREANPEQYTAMANWVMNLTGRGKLLEFMEDSPKAQRVLGDTFYGARLMASRFNLLNPNTYIKMPKEQRIEALKDMAAYASVAAITMIGMAGAGAKVSLDPDDPDFLKARWGTKRYDFTTGGMSVYMRFFFKLAKAMYVNTHAQITGEGKKDAKKYGAHSLKNSANFFRYKLAPNTAYVISGLSGTDALGNDFDPSEVLNFTPMYYNDMRDAFKKDEGMISPFTVLMPNIFGIGTQDYDNGKKEKKDVKRNPRD